jgi:hypothetical protein
MKLFYLERGFVIVSRRISNMRWVDYKLVRNSDLIKQVCCAQFGQLEREATLFQLRTLYVLLALEVKSTVCFQAATWEQPALKLDSE